MNLRRVSLLLPVAVLVSACGGSGVGNYELEPTRSCLEDSELRPTQRKVDFVASTALGGAMRVRIAQNDLSLAFGESEQEAERIEKAYRRFAPKRFPIQDVLRRDRNVVMLWGVSPTIDQLDAVNRCLRS
jgi:hypothetical protein